MKKKFVCTLLVALCTLGAFAQEKKMPQRIELAQVEQQDGTTTLEVFNAPKDGENHYYLSVGHLSTGDEVVQVLFDPISELFIPLGNTLAETQAAMEQLKALCTDTPGTTLEMPGCLTIAFPNDKLETVKITCRKVLLGRKLEFSLEREGYIRATYISKSDIKSITSSIKLYRKIHPKEQ